MTYHETETADRGLDEDGRTPEEARADSEYWEQYRALQDKHNAETRALSDRQGDESLSLHLQNPNSPSARAYLEGYGSKPEGVARIESVRQTMEHDDQAAPEN